MFVSQSSPFSHSHRFQLGIQIVCIGLSVWTCYKGVSWWLDECIACCCRHRQVVVARVVRPVCRHIRMSLLLVLATATTTTTINNLTKLSNTCTIYVHLVCMYYLCTRNWYVWVCNQTSEDNEKCLHTKCSFRFY